MEFKALRYFHEAARGGSIRRASEILHVTPSSVSRAVSALEHDFGAPLFERSPKGVTLTAAGTLLARQTGRMFRDLDRVKDAIEDLRGLNRGKVILYGAEGLVAEFLPRVIKDFCARHPQIGFDFHFDSTDAIVTAVLDDVADIGITFNAPHRLDMAILAEYTEPLFCLVRPGHPIEARAVAGTVTLADLIDMPLALPETSFGMRRMVDKAFLAASSRPKIVVNTNSLELTKRVAMKGDALAFMPTFMVKDEIAAQRLTALRVNDPAFQEARVSVCVHRDRELSFASKALADTLVRHFQSLAEETT